MKITESNYEKFYFGNACECYIQGEFYALGYEALKPILDIGYDLLVTNIARTKFLKETPIQFNVQVKGRVCTDEKATFFINKDDLHNILQDENGILICVFCHPDYSDGREDVYISSHIDPVQSSHMMESFARQLMNDVEWPSLKQLKEKNIPYVGFKKDYIWLNSAHLKRLYNKGYFYDYQDCFCLRFGMDGELKYPIDKNGKRLMTSELYLEDGYYSYEVSNIKYLTKMSSDLQEGKMFRGDIYY